jgi:acetyl-CoA carboxylase beta subunit
MGHSKNIFMEERLVSNCCNSDDRVFNGEWYSDMEVCPRCKEHCEFIAITEEEMKVEILTGKKDTNE